MLMTQKTFSLISGLVFALVALVHLWRLADGWNITVYGMALPMWASWAGFSIPGILAFYGLIYALRK